MKKASIGLNLLMATTVMALPTGTSLPELKWEAPQIELPETTLATDRVAPKVEEPVNWHTDFDFALLEAVADYKSVLVFVTSPSCGYCHAMKRSVLGDPDVGKRLREFSLCEMDTSLQPILARRYGIRSVPTIMVLSSDGRERGRVEGFLGKEALISVLETAL